MANQHDQLMKELLATFPDQFLRLVAPMIAERIDLETLTFEPEEHYPGSPSGRERRADLVARATVLPAAEDPRDDEATVVLHAEIELRYRARTEPRLLGYHRGLSLKYALVVHTFVLYLRGGPPGAQCNIYEEQSLGETVVTFRYHSLGLSRAPAADFLTRPEPLAWALAALMRLAPDQSRPQLGLDCVRRIVRAPGLTRKERDLLFECVMRYANLKDLEASEFDMILGETEDEEVRNMTTTMVEWWRKQGIEQGREQGIEQGREQGIEQGREQGIEQGREQGIEQGRTKGQRELVLRILQERFGSLSSGVRRKISAIESVDELTRLATRTLQVESLEELGLA